MKVRESIVRRRKSKGKEFREERAWYVLEVVRRLMWLKFGDSGGGKISRRVREVVGVRLCYVL